MQDRLMTKYRSVVNSSLHDFLWGALIGDSCIRVRMANTACISFQDSRDQEYVKWKIDKLSTAFKFRPNGKYRYDSEFGFELKLIKDLLGERDPRVMLRDHYSDIGMAVWYMDDGHLDLNNRKRVTLSIKRFKGDNQKLDEIANLLASRGVPCSSVIYNSGSIIFTQDKLTNLFDKIHKYIPICMQYKLPDEYKGKYEEFELKYSEMFKEYYVPVTMVRPISEAQSRHPFVYSIDVADADNFVVGGIANGIVVKN